MTADLHCAVGGAGPGLVLLHPVGLDHTFWGPLSATAARTYRVVAIDLRGHGLSPPARKGTLFEDYVDDIHAAIGQHGVAPAVVLGLSFGGMLAQGLALRHPDDVAALIACGCPGGIGLDLRPTMRERGLAAERGGMAAVLEATLERWFTAPFRSSASVQRVCDRLLDNDEASWSAAWHAIAEFDALPRLQDIGVPTLVIAGEKDAATPLAASKAIADAIPAARLTVLPGAPHMMQIETATIFTTAIAAFLEEHRNRLARAPSRGGG